jgi:uncharacterized protein
MDVTPLIPAGRQVIEGYAPGQFRVSGVVHQGGILVFPDHTEPWRESDAAALTADSFAALRQVAPPVEILLVGCGPRMVLVAPAVRRALREVGIVIETMDTGAACRTYNVLLAEGRPVAAALMPI